MQGSGGAAPEGSSSAGRPFGYGAVLPCSPRGSGAGGSTAWTMVEEKMLRDVAAWLSPADLRRARLVCKAWCGALATLSTRATTPPEAALSQWKGQLEAMVLAMPCLQELTIGSRLSSVGTQQLGVLAGAKQLRSLSIPHGQALQDRSLLALQPLASRLRELRIRGAASLSNRALLLLSVLSNLELLELRNCGRISWFELQQAWHAACVAYEAQAAAEAAAAAAASSDSSGGGAPSCSGAQNSSGGGGSGRSSSSGGRSGKLSWLPTGRLFRTSSPSSNAIQSAVVSQRSSATNLVARVQELARSTSGAAAVAVAQLGIGAVGNGRSSSGGGAQEGTARKLLHRKQKLGAAVAAAAQAPQLQRAASAFAAAATVADCSRPLAAAGEAGPGSLGPPRASLLGLRAASTSAIECGAPRPASKLSRVGSLMWQSASASAASLASSVSRSSSSSELAKQSSCVHAALLAYIAGEEQAAAELELCLDGSADAAAVAAARQPQPGDAGGAVPGAAISSAAAAGDSSSSVAQAVPGPEGELALQAPPLQDTLPPSSGAASAHASSSDGLVQPAASSEPAGAAQPAPAPAPAASRFKPRRRTTGDRTLPAMPFTKLASLSFTCSEVTLRNPGPEMAAVAALTSLTALDMGKAKLPDAVFGQLRGLSRLAKLKLSGAWAMGDAGLAEVAALSGLRSLALSEAMHVTPAGLAALSQLSGLTSLALALTQDWGPGVLGRVAASLPRLRCLEVSAACWDDVDCELLAAAAASAAPAAPAAAGSGSLAAAAAAAAAGALAAAPPPLMLWNVPGLLVAGSCGSFSHGSAASSAAGRPVLPPPLSACSSRSSSMNQRAPSFCSIASFGSFSHSAGLAGLAAASCCGQPQPPRAQLLVLRLHGAHSLTARGMAALKQLPELRTLAVDGGSELHAAEAIGHDLLPPRLASLSLRGLAFGNLFAGCVSVPACGTGLTRLELAGLQGVHDGQLRRLCGFVPRLEDLSLAGSDIGDAALPHLALLPRLRVLSLAGTRVSGRGGALEPLAGLGELRELSLRGCGQLADDALPALAALPALQTLDVAECGGLSEGGLLALLRAAPALVRLDASGCKGVSRRLVAACPHHVHLRHSF